MKPGHPTKFMTEEQKAIANSLKTCGDRIKQLQKMQVDYNASINKKIKAVRHEINNIQSRCDHVDDGGMFVSICSICGFSDGF